MPYPGENARSSGTFSVMGFSEGMGIVRIFSERAPTAPRSQEKLVRRKAGRREIG